MTVTLVTGASRGIGLELCRQLRRRGDAVIAACRRASDGLRSLDCRIVEGVEVTDDESVARLAAGLRGERLDLLVNNAGILSVETLDDLDFEHPARTAAERRSKAARDPERKSAA